MYFIPCQIEMAKEQEYIVVYQGEGGGGGGLGVLPYKGLPGDPTGYGFQDFMS